MYYSTTKKLGSKNKKKSLPRAWPMALGKENFQKNKKSLPSAWRRALGKDWRQWPPWPIRPYLPRANLPRARPLAKIYFAEGSWAGPRQRPPLPSTRDVALGKPTSPRQRFFIFLNILCRGPLARPSAKTPFAEGQPRPSAKIFYFLFKYFLPRAIGEALGKDFFLGFLNPVFLWCYNTLFKTQF